VTLILKHPEERMAYRLSRRLGLIPPINVLKIAALYASVEEKIFPVDIDGLCLDLKKLGKRPMIWLNAKLPHHRKRFTLAHEIGHVVIPWHSGSIVDDLDGEDPGERSAYREMEAEANRFASELLMPQAWSAALCERAEHMRGAMHTIAQVADVSLQAAYLRTIQCGPAGYLAAGVQNGTIIFSAKTRGTKGSAPNVGMPIADLDMPAYQDAEILNYSSVAYHWWKARMEIEIPDCPDQPWRDILIQITDNIEPEQTFDVHQRLNAIIGNALGKFARGSSVSVMYQQCLYALQNRVDRNDNLKRALEHPELNNYVLARAYERSRS
jgi:Zn-dependent peptidase ImmA (M78 family)